MKHKTKSVRLELNYVTVFLFLKYWKEILSDEYNPYLMLNIHQIYVSFCFDHCDGYGYNSHNSDD